MAGGLLTLQMTGLEAAIRHLEQVAARMRDQSPAWQVIGRMLTAQTAARWGQDWPARKTEPGWPILRHTGALFATMTGPGVILARKDGVRYGIPGGKPTFHQYGTRRGLPARPMARLNGDERAQAKALLRSYVLNGQMSGGGPWQMVG